LEDLSLLHHRSEPPFQESAYPPANILITAVDQTTGIERIPNLVA
jgi:hypothetical protein